MKCIAIKLPESLLEEADTVLREYGARLNISSRSELVRKALRRYLDEIYRLLEAAKRFNANDAFFKCPLCSDMVKDIELHVKLKHLDPRRKVCPICKQRFSAPRGLKAHVSRRLFLTRDPRYAALVLALIDTPCKARELALEILSTNACYLSAGPKRDPSNGNGEAHRQTPYAVTSPVRSRRLVPPWVTTT